MAIFTKEEVKEFEQWWWGGWKEGGKPVVEAGLVYTEDGEGVEVKGTQTEASSIILTKNEVNLSRAQGGSMVLFVLHSIVMSKKTVKKGSGIVKIIDPWQVTDDRLTPISFTYRLS